MTLQQILACIEGLQAQADQGVEIPDVVYLDLLKQVVEAVLTP